MTDQAVLDHIGGTAYAGKVTSMMPVPEGWFVRTETRETKPGEEPCFSGPRWHPMIGWGTVETLDRRGIPFNSVEPLFLDITGVTHSSEYRWMSSAGATDEDGWRTSVSIDVVPPEATREALERLNNPDVTSSDDSHPRT